MGGRVATIRGESKWPEAGFPAKEGKNQSGAVRESGARRRVKEVEEASCGLKTTRDIPQLVPFLFSGGLRLGLPGSVFRNFGSYSSSPSLPTTKQ